MIAALAIAAIYLILFAVAILRRPQRDSSESWLLGYCFYSALLMGLHGLILSADTIDPSSSVIAIVGLMFSVSLLGFLTLAYLNRPMPAWWSALNVLWIGAVLVADLSNAPSILDSQTHIPTLGPDLTLSAEIITLGWLAMSLILFAITTRAFLKEPLPLYANRILFWAVILPFVLLGDLLSAWLNPPWNYVGYGLRLLGTIGITYGILTYRIPDLRGGFRWLVSRSILTLMTAVLALGGILAALYLRIPAELGLNPVASQWVLFVAAALLVAVLQQPLRQFLRLLLHNLIVREVIDPTEAVQRYGQRISQVIDLYQLAEVAIETINELLTTRKGYLILATQAEEQVILDALGGDSAAAPPPSGILSIDGPIYRYFMSTNRPLLQYDIDYHKDYREAPASERRYFTRLEMDIYAPIIDDEKLIGLIALGPKANDDPFLPPEMPLLTALAQQTVVGLENARLVADLRGLNQEISALNEDLSMTNQQLERLDAVKTDFITIASHELRTPLTQIQGYSDLLGEMSSRNMLDADQTQEITRSLSQASARMAEVIGSMLDVSQIDVENMGLNFVETGLASVIKLAIDPYTEAIEERNLTLAARGLRNLPNINADYKRLVQAFQNLISNAIKYTPDGGTINIVGQIYKRNTDDEPVSIQLSISDTGIGIDEEQHELIFEKFYRVGSTALHSTGTTKFKGAGPGLGLPITKGIIEGHGGQIWVESKGHDEENMLGSTFHIVLPIRPPAMEVKERLQEIQVVISEEREGEEGEELDATRIGPSPFADLLKAVKKTDSESTD